MDDYDIERELYLAMEEDTEGLGVPELDLGRMRRSGRRRAALVAGSSAAVLIVGAGAAFALGYHSGKGSGNALGGPAAPVAVPSGGPSSGIQCLAAYAGQGAPTAPGEQPPSVIYAQVVPTTIDGTPRMIVPMTPPQMLIPQLSTPLLTEAQRYSEMYVRDCTVPMVVFNTNPGPTSTPSASGGS